MHFDIGQSLTPRQAMEYSIYLAQKAKADTIPNPIVGCVVLDKDHCLVSTGFHQQYGGPHAEVYALQGLDRQKVTEGSIFVTLEPCNHFGKTPPCADLVIQFPFKKMYFGNLDPNPQVSGSGLDKIRRQGIEVLPYETDLQEQLKELNEVFFYNMKNKKPFVAVKVASDPEGVISFGDGKSKKITGVDSLNYMHQLRSYYSTVAVGKNTLFLDNPKLNIRLQGSLEKTNQLLIFDSAAESLKEIEKLNVYKVRSLQQIFILGDKIPEFSMSPDEQVLKLANGIRLINTKNMNYDELLKLLYDNGVFSIFVEGGAKLYSFFLHNGFQRLYWWQSSVVLPTKNSLHWLQYANLKQEQVLSKLSNLKKIEFNQDLLLTGRSSTTT